jgi:hypothetical protein
LLDAFLSRTRLVEVYYRWRPNLPDEGDNPVLELAVAAGDAPIVTFNRRDFRSGELHFPGIIVQTPGAWLKSPARILARLEELDARCYLRTIGCIFFAR